MAESYLPPIDKQTELPIARGEAFRLWTTRDGLVSFFAADARIELRSGGPFEILFDLDAPVGEQGSEGCQVLCWQADRMLAVSWNAPPIFPRERAEPFEPNGARPFVIVGLHDVGADACRLTIHHGGMPHRGQWPEVREYFVRAWSSVLCWLETRVASGPIDWKAGAPPKPTRSYDV